MDLNSTFKKGRLCWQGLFSSLTLVVFLASAPLSAFTADGPANPQVSQLPNGWTEVKPGGESICARGGEYSFFYRKGTTNKWVVDFIGGGACWNEETCAKNSGIFWDSVDLLRERVKSGLEGIYDHSNPANPVADWNHIVIPYCTGDIHWGDSVVTYGQGEKAFTIHHKGATNAKMVLEWMNKNMAQEEAQPEKLFITGCSAGSYGSVYWAPYIKEQFPHTKIYQLGDSGAGVITKDFIRNNFSRWNAVKNAPTWITTLDPNHVDWYGLSSAYMYTEIGKFYPDMRLSQFHTAFDSNQVFFYETMGGHGEDVWSKQMFSFMDDISHNTPNFNYYVGGGDTHCIIPYDYFYTKTTDGVRFIDWLGNYLEDKEVGNVTCKGINCDPIE